MNFEDWKAANQVADCISRLNTAIFSNHVDIVGAKIVLITDRSPDTPHYIEYSHPNYHVFVPGIAAHLQQAANGKVILLDGKLPLDKLPDLTLDVLIVGIAAHEVRHRLQHFLPQSCWYSPFSSPRDDLMRKAVKFVARLFSYDSPRGNYAKEFDAKVIEYAVMDRYWRTQQIAPLAKIIDSLP